MPEPLSVAVAQPPCAPYDVAANARAHAAAVRRAGARVVVFLELSLTGYELDAAPVDPADERLVPLTGACAETAASRPGTGSGWRWPASPGPPAAATTRPRGGPGSGRPTVP